MPQPGALSRFTGFDGPGRWRIAGLCFVFAWFLLGGIAHFVFTDTEMRIVPPVLPWPRLPVPVGLLALILWSMASPG